MNGKILHKKWLYMNYLKNLFSTTFKWETQTMHVKGALLKASLEKKNASKKITFAKDVFKSPTIIFDFVVDNMLFIYLIIKLAMFIVDPFDHDGNEHSGDNATDVEHRTLLINLRATATGAGGQQGGSADNVTLNLDDLDKITVWTDLYGAFAIIAMWLSAFLKLQITETGPFVIYMKAVAKDLATIGTMFIFLFIPAACVFYKTIYVYSEVVTWYEVLFMVARMSMIDYDYDGGLALSGKVIMVYRCSVFLSIYDKEIEQVLL